MLMAYYAPIRLANTARLSCYRGFATIRTPRSAIRCAHYAERTK